MLRSLLVIAALAAPFGASAEIYRWVDEDGRVHFSDRWNQGSEKLATARQAESGEARPSAVEPERPDELFLGPYESLEIVSPAANETLTQSTDGVAVSLLVNPALIGGHQMSVLLDDVALPVANAATQFKLTGAALGSHRLQLRVKATDGRTVAQTAPQTFHLQKPKEPGQLR